MEGPRPVVSIVEYTDQKPAADEFPARIVSPVHASHCCLTEMEAVGEPQREERWIYQYRRCRGCGFTVRLIVRQLPDERLDAQLRDMFKASALRASSD
jgi:hypothetical protein